MADSAVRHDVGPHAALHGRTGDWLALLAGVPFPLAFAPFELYPLAIVCVAALFVLWDGISPRHAARRGFLFGFSAFLGGIYWIYISVHIFGKAPLFVAVPLMVGLVAILAAYLAALGFFANRLLAPRGAGRWLLGLPAGWTLLEWLRGWLFSGFPWLSLGYTQVDAPLAGFAPVLGVFGTGWVIALSAAALAALLLERGVARHVGAVVVALLWALGFALRGVAWTVPEGDALDVRILQGGVSQDRKWLAEELEPTKALYRRLTLENLDADLVIWPEVAVPATLDELEDYLPDLLSVLANQRVSLVMGILRRDFVAGQYYNSVLVFDGFGSDGALHLYDKRHLVPFGEYFPVPDFVRQWMRLMSLPYVDFAAGDDDQPALSAAGQKLGLSICYEDVFGEEMIGVLPDATLLVNVSNDAWFGGSVAPHQHLQITRMRALEAGRMLLRATNTGISAVIGPHGELEQTSPQFETAVLSARAQPRVGATPYSKLGNVPAVVGALVLLAAGINRRRAYQTAHGQG